MSRCIACDKVLNDSELRAKTTLPDGTKVYRDTCNYCNNFVRNPNFTPKSIGDEFALDLNHKENEYDD